MWKFFCCSFEKKYKLQLTLINQLAKSDLYILWLLYDFEYKISKINQLIQIIK